LGGDEFALVVQGADKLHAAAVVERTRQQVSEVLLPHERMLTLSCGIACTPEHATNIAELVSYADRALYQAKRAGRDRSIVYSASLFDVEPGRDSRRVLQTLADALAAAVDAKDAYTHAHSRNVADLSLYIARTMGFDDNQVADIALGGLLHDIGKIGVSDHVLRKPGKLNDEEWEEIKTHCEIGYTILSGIEGAQHIREMVLYHHERPDGRGYPRGLAGDEIPMAARIIGVADAFDSMTAERVYSRPRSPNDALAEIVRLAGDQFDSQVVDALCQLMLFELSPSAIEYTPEPTPVLEAFPDTGAYRDDDEDQDEGQDHAAAA
jgi:putative nucleotidyltransferase with HDIG domain